MRLQVVVLSVLAAAAAAVHPATSNRSHTKRSFTRTLESASPISPTPRARRTRSSLYTATTTTGTTTVSPNSVSTEAARQGARGHIRASDTNLVSVQHWPARPEESTTVPSGQVSYRTAQRRGWEDDLQETIRPKPREEKRYWPKPTQVADIPNPTEDPPGDWSERVGVGDEETDSVQKPSPKPKDSESQESRKNLEDRKDWTVTVRTPSPSELAELNNFAARLTHQLEQEAKEHIKLQHEQNLRHQQQQQMQRTQQELQHRLKEAQALQQTLAEEERQRQQQQPRLTLGQLVEVEVVDASGEDDENAGRRWGDHEDHEQEVHIVKVPVPQPVPVAVPQPVPVAVPHPVPVRVKVAEHIEVPVVRTVAVPVETPVPVKIEHLVPYPIEKPVPVPVEKHIPFPIHEPYPVKRFI
ncbi:Uncharacterized protein GBIM_19593 [Gryllus bimaculatus]|nr:Uncharacterized protein GBIM_19593 [Gryllus bimaculatus]